MSTEPVERRCWQTASGSLAVIYRILIQDGFSRVVDELLMKRTKNTKILTNFPKLDDAFPVTRGQFEKFPPHLGLSSLEIFLIKSDRQLKSSDSHFSFSIWCEP